MISFAECPLPFFVGRHAAVSVSSPEEPPSVVTIYPHDEQAFLSVVSLLAGNSLRQRQGISIEGAMMATCQERCALCQPLVVIKDGGVQFIRHMYEPGSRSSDTSFEVLCYRREEATRPEIAIVFIDDNEVLVTQLAQFYSREFTTIAIHISGHKRMSSEDLKHLRSIINDAAPLVCVIDKNMNAFDSIEFIEWMNSLGIVTIMLTAEIQTRESKRLATYFLTKNHRLSLHDLRGIINSVTNQCSSE